MTFPSVIPMPEAQTWPQKLDAIIGDIAARSAAHDAEDTYVEESLAQLKLAGFLKAHVPAELGGWGLSHRETGRLIRRIAAACGSTGLTYSMHSHLVALAAWERRSRAQCLVPDSATEDGDPSIGP